MKVAILISYLRTELIDNVVKLAAENSGIPKEDFFIKTFHNKKVLPVAISVNNLVESTESDIICFLADDCIPEPNYLKNALEAMKTLPNGCGVVMMNDGTNIDRPSHFIIDRGMIPLLGGKLVHEGYHHCCSDLEMMDRSRFLGRYTYCKEALVIHNHPLLNKDVKEDKFYKMWYDKEKQAEDRELYRRRKESNWKYKKGDPYIKIAIALTSDGKHHTRTTIALMKLHTYITNNYGRPIIPFSFGRVETASNLCVELALKKGATHILFVDADADFEEDCIKHLVDADKEIIGCNAALKTSEEPVIENDFDGNELNYIKDSIKQVEWVGMHLTLIKKSVFEKMEQPYFWAKPGPGNPKVNSQDVTFCKNAWYGYQIPTYCHLDVSRTVGHVIWRNTVAYLTAHVRKQVDKMKNSIFDNIKNHM